MVIITWTIVSIEKKRLWISYDLKGREIELQNYYVRFKENYYRSDERAWAVLTRGINIEMPRVGSILTGTIRPNSEYRVMEFFENNGSPISNETLWFNIVDVKKVKPFRSYPSFDICKFDIDGLEAEQQILIDKYKIGRFGGPVTYAENGIERIASNAGAAIAKGDRVSGSLRVRGHNLYIKYDSPFMNQGPSR